MSAASLEDGLRAGLDELGLVLSERPIARLLAYLDLLAKWNRVYNLTAVREPKHMLTHHVLDSLAAVRPLRTALGEGPARLLDVGSGGGLPGVVLAICNSNWTVDCVDTVAKKAAFLQQTAVTLQLTNLRALHDRVENLRDSYDVIVSRAFASLVDFVSLSDAALKPGGGWLAMKGKTPTEEVAALPPGVRVFHVEQLKVPGLDAERCLVWMERAEP